MNWQLLCKKDLDVFEADDKDFRQQKILWIVSYLKQTQVLSWCDLPLPCLTHGSNKQLVTDVTGPGKNIGDALGLNDDAQLFPTRE